MSLQCAPWATLRWQSELIFRYAIFRFSSLDRQMETFVFFFCCYEIDTIIEQYAKKEKKFQNRSLTCPLFEYSDSFVEIAVDISWSLKVCYYRGVIIDETFTICNKSWSAWGWNFASLLAIVPCLYSILNRWS